MKRGITHFAGPMVDLVQRCSMCGAVLCDYRNTASPSGDFIPKGWGVGEFVTVLSGNPTFWKLGKDEDADHCAVDRILGPAIEPSAATREALKASLN